MRTPEFHDSPFTLHAPSTHAALGAQISLSDQAWISIFQLAHKDPEAAWKQLLPRLGGYLSDHLEALARELDPTYPLPGGLVRDSPEARIAQHLRRHANEVRAEVNALA